MLLYLAVITHNEGLYPELAVPSLVTEKRKVPLPYGEDLVVPRPKQSCIKPYLVGLSSLGILIVKPVKRVAVYYGGASVLKENNVLHIIELLLVGRNIVLHIKTIIGAKEYRLGRWVVPASVYLRHRRCIPQF